MITYFQDVRRGNVVNWRAVNYIDAQPSTPSLRAGDILVRDGHVMIAMERPEPVPASRGGGWR